MKNIIITGSSGLVATELIVRLLDIGGYRIYAVSTKPQALKKRYEDEERICCLQLSELKEAIEGMEIYSLVHCAFARSKSGRDIAASLEFLRETLNAIKGVALRSFINISSQSVYGQRENPLWTEETPVDPDYLYAVGKYASEVIVKSSLNTSNVEFTNIRLASVCENARFLNIFVKNAIEGRPIRVIGGSQSCSLIDVRDVSEGLVSVIENRDDIKLENIYNLGTGKACTINELADLVSLIYKSDYGKEVTTEREKSDINLNVGMDNTLFCKSFKWIPKYDYEGMIKSLIEYNIHGGGYPVAFDMVYRYTKYIRN